MRAPPLPANFSHASPCKPFCEKSLTLPVEELRSMKLKEAAKKVEDGIEETLTYCDFPSEHWTRIRTNNVIERLNREIRRRTSVVGIFPSADDYTRLVTTCLMEYAEDWSASRAYLSEQSVQAILRPAA